VTACTMVDYDTVAGGDKFGNLFVDRLPSDTSTEVDEDPTGSRLVYERGYLNGAPYKVCGVYIKAQLCCSPDSAT
jgi:splicing factor 3B subunit 3